MELKDLGGDMPFIKDLGNLPGDDYITTMAIGEEDGGFTPPYESSPLDGLGGLGASIRDQVRSNLSGLPTLPGLDD